MKSTRENLLTVSHVSVIFPLQGILLSLITGISLLISCFTLCRIAVYMIDILLDTENYLAIYLVTFTHLDYKICIEYRKHPDGKLF